MKKLRLYRRLVSKIPIPMPAHGKIELVKKVSLNVDEHGLLVGLCCSMDNNCYIALKKNDVTTLFEVNIKSGQIENPKLIGEKVDIVSMEFDKHSHFYIVTKQYGLSVYKSVNSIEPLYKDSEWKGLLCPMQGTMDAMFGIYEGDICRIDFPDNVQSSPKIGIESYSNENSTYMTSVKNITKKWSHKLPDDNVHMKICYYADRIMYYFKEQNSYKQLDDGIKSLHYFGKDVVLDTYMHVPIKAPFAIPFSFEIPICTYDELLFLSVAGVYNNDGERLLSFDYTDECNNSFGSDSIEPYIYSATSHNGYRVPKRSLLCGLTCKDINVIHIMKEYSCKEL